MKIAMFSDSYKPQVNGLVTSVDTFAGHIRKKGHDVHIFAPRVPGYKDKDKRVHRFKSFRFPAYDEYRIAVPHLIKDGFDIVHVHSPFSVGIAGILYARKNNVPLVGTFHTLFSEYGHYLIKSEKLLEVFDGMYKKISWAYLRWFYNQCDYVTAPSERIKKLLMRHGIRKPIYVIPTGIEMLRKASRKKSRSSFGNEKIILHVGRITKEKNIMFILRSLKPLLESENAVLVIASDGPYRHVLEKEIRKLGLQGKVKFTGYISGGQLKELYAIADVFVMASKTETQGIVLIEAVANKMPVVALSAPVTADFLRENNYGIVASSINFADKVRLVLSSEKARKYCVRNAPAIIKKYDASACAGEMIRVYGKAMHGKR